MGGIVGHLAFPPPNRARPPRPVFLNSWPSQVLKLGLLGFIFPQIEQELPWQHQVKGIHQRVKHSKESQMGSHFGFTGLRLNSPAHRHNGKQVKWGKGTTSQQATQWQKPLYLHASQSVLPHSETSGQRGANGRGPTTPLSHVVTPGSLVWGNPFTPQTVPEASRGSSGHQINQADQTNIKKVLKIKLPLEPQPTRVGQALHAKS